MRQAYLFAGPRGTGKTSLARILAKALNCAQGPTPTPDKTCHACVTIAERHLARRDRDGRRLAARDRRHPRDPRARRAPAGRGPLQGLHPRRGAPAHRRRLERAPEADRGAAAPPRLRLLHDRPREGAADRPLALPDVRLRAAAAARARARCCAGSPTARGSTRPTRRSRSIARARARQLPRRGLDARPARRRDRAARSPCRPCSQLLGAVEEEALFRLCDLVVDRDTAGALTLRRGALRAGPGPRPARHRPARAPAAPAARPAHGRGARLAAGDRGDARAAARAGEPARRGDRAAADRPARRRRRRHAPGRRPAPAARARAREGDAARRPTSRASRSRYRLEQLEQRGACAATPPRDQSPAAGTRAGRRRPPAPERRRPDAAVARARAAPGGLAADDPPGGRGAVDPDRVDARARRTRSALDGDTLDARVPARAPRSTASSPRSRRTRRCSPTRSTR